MSSIRPLVTITILVFVGVFLFTKINEVPIDVPPESEGTLASAPPVEVPPLATSTDIPAPTTLTPAPQTTIVDTATAPPAVPAVPELPPLVTPAESQSASTAPQSSPPVELPTNIPMARYPGDAAQAAVEPLTPPIAAPEVVAADTMPQSPTVEAVSPVAPMTPIGADNRYGAIAAAPEPAAVAAMTAPVAEQSFAASWPEIQSALDRQELVQAHEKLSRWYGNPSLSPAEAQQVEMLLSQLAGTVVYSTEHRLEPPYTVQSGDTLQTIAQKYEVPWQLLAKINGIPAAELVRPGQQLKVVHGPFSAVVELTHSQLTLMLEGRYAGRFPITLEPGAAANEGEWVLEQKLVNPSPDPTGVVSASYSMPTPVDRVLVLRSESPTAAGATISITGGPTSPAGPTAVAPAAIRLSPADAEEVADILSVGSRVTIRR